MQYNEEKAKELIEKFGLSKNLWKVWAVRGHIPDIYEDAEYTKPVEMSSAEKIKIQSVLEFFQRGKVQANLICELAGLDYQSIADYRRGKGQIWSHEARALVNEIQKIRVLIVKIIEPIKQKNRFSDSQKKQIDKLLTDERFVLSKLIGYGKPYERHYNRRKKPQAISEDWEFTEIIGKLELFVLESTI